MNTKRYIGIEYVRRLLRQGRSSFTRDEAAMELVRSGASLSNILARLEKAGWIMPVAKGFYAVIEPGRQAFGFAAPQMWLDDWANRREFPYYVGGISAAEMHGAAHQRPQVFQVVVDHAVPEFQYRDLKIAFFRKRTITQEMWEQRSVPAGYLRVSTPETTAYDLLYLPRACRSLSRVATVLVELGEVMKPGKLAALCEVECETVPLQRLGWLLDRTGWAKLTQGLHKALESRHPAWRSLEPSLPSCGKRNGRWHIVENTDVEPDID